MFYHVASCVAILLCMSCMLACVITKTMKSDSNLNPSILKYMTLNILLFVGYDLMMILVEPLIHLHKYPEYLKTKFMHTVYKLVLFSLIVTCVSFVCYMLVYGMNSETIELFDIFNVLTLIGIIGVCNSVRGFIGSFYEIGYYDGFKWGNQIEFIDKKRYFYLGSMLTKNNEFGFKLNIFNKTINLSQMFDASWIFLTIQSIQSSRGLEYLMDSGVWWNVFKSSILYGTVYIFMHMIFMCFDSRSRSNSKKFEYTYQSIKALYLISIIGICWAFVEYINNDQIYVFDFGLVTSVVITIHRVNYNILRIDKSDLILNLNSNSNSNLHDELVHV